MKLSSTLAATGLTILGLGVGSLAQADDAYWYLGAGGGLSQATIDDKSIVDGLAQRGFATTSITDDDHDRGYKFFGGYRFNRYMALEASYFDLGRFGFTAVTVPPGTLGGTLKANGASLDAIASLPLGSKFSVFGRFGANNANVRDRFSTTGLVNVSSTERSKRSTHYKFGAGVQYDLTQAFAVRLEAERYRIDDAFGNLGDLDLLSLGVLYSFNRHAPEQAQIERTPLATPPEPILVVVPAPARSQEYCSILDFQFEINQDDIQRQEKEKLSVLGTFLTKYPETTAVIEGHTDDVGTAADNLKLSQRRADSVVAYLVETYRVAPTRLSAIGYGDTRPVGNNQTQVGKRQNRRINAIVACATDITGLTVLPARMTMALLIEFDRNQSVVKPQYHDELEKVATFLRANPSVTATVEGHTANLQATPELAFKISEQRARNVVDYLVANFAIDRARLSAQGFGETRRFAYNTSAEGQQENRRVNVIINYPK